MAKTIIAAIQRRGGQVMVRAPVEEILVDDNKRAFGVR
jgi:phytoene dehydrogenase-like protein